VYIRRSHSTLPFFCSALLFAGCRHASSIPDFLRTDGFRYRVGSAVVGAAFDTLRIAVVAVNGSRETRAIMFSSPCAPFNRIAVSITGAGRKWDSDTWRPAIRPATRTVSGQPIVFACSMVIMGMYPGTSRTFALTVPVKEVLGDSLPNGRYRVTARARINGDMVRGLDAGDVDLSSPRPPVSSPQPH
jgi:hypothetical protein